MLRYFASRMENLVFILFPPVYIAGLSGVIGLSFWYALVVVFAAAVALPAGITAGERFTDGMLLNFAVAPVTGVAAILWRTGYLLSRRPKLVRLMFPALGLLCLSSW